MASPELLMELAEAVEDEEITQAEVTSMMTTIFNTVIGGIMVAYGLYMVNKLASIGPRIGLEE